MAKIIATGIVSEEGKLTLTAEKKFKADLMAFKGKPVVLTLEKKSRKRSVAQNSYYWGVCIDISVNAFRNLGNDFTADQVHEIFKFKFLKTNLVDKETGEVFEYTKSTTELSVSDFIDYIDSIQTYMADMYHVHIPDARPFLSETV